MMQKKSKQPAQKVWRIAWYVVSCVSLAALLALLGSMASHEPDTFRWYFLSAILVIGMTMLSLYAEPRERSQKQNKVGRD